MTPEIAIDYTTEELINFVEDGTYTINGLDVTLTDNKLSLANYITNEQITLSIVKKGNNVTTVASEAQTLIVKARPAAPTKSEIIVTQPSVIGGKGTRKPKGSLRVQNIRLQLLRMMQCRKLSLQSRLTM